ncbi:MAG: PAS domain S-box protein [Thermodesulfobacteriota bacterium]
MPLQTPKKLLWTFVLLLFIGGGSPPGTKAADSPAAPRRTLRAASELDYPPFALVRKDGAADGFSVELLQAVAHAVGLDVAVDVGPWHVIKQQLADGHLDVLPLVSYSAERDRVFDFTSPYLRMHGSIFVRREETAIRAEADLRGREVLVMRGDTAHEYALKNELTDHLILTDTYEEAFRLLSSGRHDAVIVQQVVGFQIMKKLGIDNLTAVGSGQETSLKPMARPLSGFEQKFCLAVRDGDAELLALLNEGLSIVIASGAYDRLYAKWFEPILPKPPLPVSVILTYLLAVLGPLIFLSALAVLWYLKREVARRTRSLREEILERRRSEEALAASREQFMLAVKGTQDGIWDWDLRTNSLYLSPRWKAIIGYGDEELANTFETFESHLHPDDRPRVMDSVDRYLRGEMPVYAVEFRFRHKDGSHRWILARGEALRDENGRSYRMAGSHTDITERKQSEEALRESEKRFRQVYEHAAVGLARVSPGFRIMTANEAYCRMLGYPEEELIGKHLQDITHPEVLEENIRNQIRLGAGEIDHFRMEKRFIHKQGHTIHGVLDANLIRDAAGRPLYFLGSVVDITDRIQAAEMQEKLQDRLQQAQKMEAIGTLAGGIAHDFNNILFPLLGFTEMLQEDLPAGSPLHANVREILQAIMRARDLVQQILAFSRQSELEIRPIRLQPVLKEALKLLQATIPKTIRFSQTIDAACGMVLCDPTQVHQIIMNLATNAYHAMEETGGELRVELRQVRVEKRDPETGGIPPGDYARLTVADTGAGIPGEILDKVFDPYFTTKAQHKGTGLGLSVVHGIVTRCHGEVRIASPPGRGTTVTVYLPVMATAPETDAEAEVKPAPGGTERLLLVDDEPAIVRMEQQMLERLGYHVTARTGSVEALTAFKEAPRAFDLVITDMTMPNMTGIQLTAEIKAIRPDMPVIICTGFSDQLNEEKCRLSGIAAYVLKPLIKREIAAAIRMVLDAGDPC